MPTIIPKAGPNVLSPPKTSASAPNSARERAIARLTQTPAQAHPVPNPTQVSPEELSAIKAPDAAPEAPEGLPEGHNDTVEAPPASEAPKAVTEEPKADEPLSAQYAQLARKEKAIRAKAHAQATEIKAKEDALAAREAAIKAKETEYTAGYVSKERIKTDILGVLAEAGVSYEDVTNLMLNQSQGPSFAKSPEYMAMQEQIKTLNERLESSSKTAAEQQSQAYQQAINQLKVDTKSLVESNPDFETIKDTGSYDDVVELIEATWKEEKRMMTVEEAAKAVEDHLVEEFLKLTKIGKLQKRLTPATPAQGAAPKQEATSTKQPQSQLKTLTNSVGGSRQLSARERAVLAFKGEKF